MFFISRKTHLDLFRYHLVHICKVRVITNHAILEFIYKCKENVITCKVETT